MFFDIFYTHPSGKRLKNKPFPYFDDFVIIFGKDRAIGEGAKTTIDAVEEANDEDDEFVVANDNYYKEPQREKEKGKGNREDIAASTCNATATTSRKNQTSKRKTRVLMGQVYWLSICSALRRHIKRLQNKSKA